MAYLFATGSVRRGDIYYEDDSQRNTYIDWSEDAVAFVCGGVDALVVSGSTGLSSSLNMSASAFYGDGSNLENVTATASPAGSDGQIQYNNGGSTGGSAQFYWDDSNNRVGIGTSAPGKDLDIEGANQAIIQLNATNYRSYNIGSDGYGFIIHDQTTGGTDGYRFVISDQAAALGYVGIGAGASIAGSNHPDALLHLSSSDDQQMLRADTTDGTTVLFATGSKRVGIGTHDPSSRLHVYGNVSSNYLTLIDNDASSAGHALKVTTDGTGAGTYVLDLESQSTTLFRVRGDGRVGIGKVTSLPSACLTVSGSNGDGDIAVGSKIQHIGDSDTYVAFENDEIILYAGGRGFIKCQEDSTDKLMLNYGGLDIDLQVKGENDANLIRTDAANDLVGIGTATPEHKLHVSASQGLVAGMFVGEVFVTGSSARLVVEETDGSDYRVVIDPNNGPLIQFGSDTADNHYMTIGAFSSLNNIDTETRDFHLYGTNTTTGFYFDESLSKFGILTNLPSSTFTVTGSFAKSIATITGTSNNIGTTHSTLLMDATSGHCAAQLPAVAGTEGRIYTFKRIDSNDSNGCKVKTNGSETIDGSSNDRDIDTQYNVLTIQSDGAAWYIINEVHFGDEGG
tara:strand:- start:5 stop:1873 length:1869 start_codon:yes stop_codon:yes gene_type:complete